MEEDGRWIMRYKSLSTRFGSRSMETSRVQEPMARGLHNFLDIRVVCSTWHPMARRSERIPDMSVRSAPRPLSRIGIKDG